MKNKKIIISIILVFVILSVAALFYANGTKQDVKIPKSQEELFTFIDSDDFKAMDDKTKKAVVGKAIQQYWNRTVDEYFATDEKDRDAYLDNVIETMEQTKKIWGERKKQENKPANKQAQQRPKKILNAEGLRQKDESADPVRLARMSEFKKAIMERMGKR